MRKDVIRRQNQSVQAPRNAYVLPEGTTPLIFPAGIMPQIPFVHSAFGTRPIFYMPPTALIRRPDDMLSLPIRQHIFNYEPPCGFAIPAFVTFNGFTDPYNHMLHNQEMIVNAGNDHLLCKVFLASLRGPTLAWLHKLPRNSINSFNDL